MKKLYFFFFISSLIMAFFQESIFDATSSDIQGLFSFGILSSIIFLLEGSFLAILTKKILFPFCIALSGFVYISIFMQIRINNSLLLYVAYSLFVIQFFRIFDILGFLSYRKFQKIKNGGIKPITETQINLRILGFIFTLLLVLLILFSGVLVNWGGLLIFMPVLFLLIVLGIAQLVALIKDIRNSKK